MSTGTSLSLVENLGKLTWVRQQEPQEQHYPFLRVQYFCVSKQWHGIWDFQWAQMLMHVTAHRGCAKSVRESALRVDLEGGGGGGIPCRTREFNF